MWMQTCTMPWSLAGLSQPFSTLSMRHPQISISKRQATVETATYGSEFVEAWIAVDQIVENLWEHGLLLTKLLTSGTPLCTLVFQSEAKVSCLETTNLSSQLHHSKLSPVRKAPHFSLPQSQGSHCLEIVHVCLER